MIVSDWIRCRLFGHRWESVFGVGGPWSFCRRCGETREAEAATEHLSPVLVDVDTSTGPRVAP